MKAVVLGGSGFLGLNIIQALKSTGHDVVATRRKSSNTIFLRRQKVAMATASLEDVESLVAAMDGADVVYFAAAHYPRYSVDTETQVTRAVAGARNVAEAARRAGVARIIYTGSVVSIRRRGDGLARETDGVADVPEGSTYFAVKVALERALMEETGVDIVHLLPTGCIGPYDHKVGTGFFVVGLATGALDVFVDGCTNLVDSRDVAAAHEAAATRGEPGERYILGAHNVRVRDLLAEMAAILEVDMPARELSPDEALAHATREEERCVREGGRGRPELSREIVDMITYGQHVDSSKAERVLGFRGRPLVDTIRASADWYRGNGFIR